MVSHDLRGIKAHIFHCWRHLLQSRSSAPNCSSVIILTRHQNRPFALLSVFYYSQPRQELIFGSVQNKKMRCKSVIVNHHVCWQRKTTTANAIRGLLSIAGFTDFPIWTAVAATLSKQNRLWERTGAANGHSLPFHGEIDKDKNIKSISQPSTL